MNKFWSFLPLLTNLLLLRGSFLMGRITDTINTVTLKGSQARTFTIFFQVIMLMLSLVNFLYLIKNPQTKNNTARVLVLIIIPVIAFAAAWSQITDTIYNLPNSTP